MNRNTEELEAYLEQNASSLVSTDDSHSGIARAAREDMNKRRLRATRLQGIRKSSLKLTQKDLAKAVGANLRTLQSWESGRQDYPKSVEILIKLMNEIPGVRKELVGGKSAA
jgi:DNA-binding transcriptional regulator YiaG